MQSTKKKEDAPKTQNQLTMEQAEKRITSDFVSMTNNLRGAIVAFRKHPTTRAMYARISYSFNGHHYTTRVDLGDVRAFVDKATLKQILIDHLSSTIATIMVNGFEIEGEQA